MTPLRRGPGIRAPRASACAAALLLTAAALAGAPAEGAAAGDLSASPPGSVVSRIPALADPTLTWDLYLPKGWVPARRWPVLLLFDPRARGRVPVDLFRDAADELGWILASSNDTRSDDAGANNSRAVQGLVTDVTRRLPVDERRIYAGGFSGGAVLAWVLALKTDWLAGAVSVGGRPAPEHAGLSPRSPVWAGAGVDDFNALPTVKLDRIAAKAGVPHRLVLYPGGHAWCDASSARDALVFHELLAARGGTSALPAEKVAALRSEQVAAARALAESGPPLAAVRRLRETAGLIADGAEAAALRARADTLESSPAAKAAAKEERAAEALEERSGSRLLAVQRLLREETPPPPAPRLVRELGIDDLRKKATGDGATAAAARRALAAVRVQLGFYDARALFAAKEWRRAVPALETASAAAPDDPALRYDLACALARSGSPDAALAALVEALDRGLPQPLQMETDADLASLRGRPGFDALVARARAAAASPRAP